MQKKIFAIIVLLILLIILIPVSMKDSNISNPTTNDKNINDNNNESKYSVELIDSSINATISTYLTDVEWHPYMNYALIVGYHSGINSKSILLKYEDGNIADLSDLMPLNAKRISGISWSPNGDYALLYGSTYYESSSMLFWIYKYQNGTITNLTTKLGNIGPLESSGTWPLSYSIQWDIRRNIAFLGFNQHNSNNSLLYNFDGQDFTNISFEITSVYKMIKMTYNHHSSTIFILDFNGKIFEYSENGLIEKAIIPLEYPNHIYFSWHPIQNYSLIGYQPSYKWEINYLFKFENDTVENLSHLMESYLDIHDISWNPNGSIGLFYGPAEEHFSYISSLVLVSNDKITEITKMNVYKISWSLETDLALFSCGNNVSVYYNESIISITSNLNETLYSLWDIDWNHFGDIALIIGRAGKILRFKLSS